MAWHARLRAEENRVTRMEQAAFKLVAAASNVLCQQGGGNIDAILYIYIYKINLTRINNM